jgi:hypothetical protein
MTTYLDTPLAAEVIEEHVGTLSADLSFLFDKEGVAKDIQAKLASLGYTDMAVFSRIEDTATAVREVLATDVGLNPKTSPAHRTMQAKVLVAWDNAKRRIETRNQEEASQRVHDAPRTLSKNAHFDLIKAYEKVHGEKPDKLNPAPAYIEAKLEQVEAGELRPENLSEVLNREDHVKPPPRLSVSANGDIQFRAGDVKGTTPSKPEELRRIFKLMGACWEFIRLKVPGKSYLADHSQAVWDDYADWLLGDDVFDCVVRDSGRDVIYKPSWNLVLDLDYQIRKLAYKLVNRTGVTIKAAMKQAMADEKLYHKFFTTPVSLAAASATKSGGAASSRGRSRSPRSAHHQAKGSGGKGSGNKGKG